ncbi:MAG: hypothetical protein KGQ16_14935 [Cyanobacteria bacterium REEB444]|nr:hypothetical protein [Cyanobacteria bacterium REEB444]
MDCPHCQSQTIVKNGKDYHQDGKVIQNYLCKECGKRFNERTGNPMSRLRTPANLDHSSQITYSLGSQGFNLNLTVLNIVDL